MLLIENFYYCVFLIIIRMILRIFIQIFILNSVSSLPFDYQVSETLEQKRPDICQCKNYNPPRGRIFNGQKVPPDDLPFVGSLYFKALDNPLKKPEDLFKKFTPHDFDYSHVATVSLLNEGK